MEEEDSNNDSTSSMSEGVVNEDIASPDPVEDAAVPVSSESFVREDDRSQTPLQDEVAGADEQVAEITGSMQEVDVSQTLQQDVTSADTAKKCDDEVLKQTIRDDHGELELDYDEEVQPDSAPIVTTNAGSPSNTCQKAVDEEEREDGEEKVKHTFGKCWRSAFA